ncbi:MAG TPA: IS1182 family transposase, partial [Candidatus Elarobacter sp.]|nr:IS1182 family transposase [Candidatus Elarobacter sp.]
RIVTANRAQLQLRPQDLESLLPADHRARALWMVVDRLDLSRFYAAIQARGSDPGRPAIDPKVLVALWLYATSEGVGSARELARLCERHDAYRWLCGGVRVNHHTLSDFRVEYGAALDALLTQVLGVMLHQGLVRLERVTQDGMRVRASAGAASFRREATLRRCVEAAREQVAAVKEAGERPADPRTARQQAAAARAAREREKRVTRALAELPAARDAKREDAAKAKARVSMTDPDARVMKMADGGYRPAYNVQLATAVEGRVIVGVQVTNAGTDLAQLTPMRAAVEQRTGQQPREYLVDGGFVQLESIAAAAADGVTVYAPVRKPPRADIDPHVAKPTDAPAVAAWRVRMGTEDAKTIYKDRAAVAETVNADLRAHRGLNRLPVRGLAKVQCIAVWAALTYNVLRWLALTA